MRCTATREESERINIEREKHIRELLTKLVSLDLSLRVVLKMALCRGFVMGREYESGESISRFSEAPKSAQKPAKVKRSARPKRLTLLQRLTRR